MPTNPSLILQGNPVPDPLQNYAHLLQLKNQQAQQQLIPQQIQAGQLENQQRTLQNQQLQQSAQQQQAVIQALQKHKGDFDAAIADLTAQGNPGALTLQENRTKAQQGVATLKETNGKIAEQAQKAQAEKSGHLADIADSILKADPAIRPYFYQAQKQFAEQIGYAKPGDLPDAYTDDVAPKLQAIVAQGRTAKDQSEIGKNAAQAGSAQAELEAKRALLPGQLKKQALDVTEGEQKTTGTVPLTAAQAYQQKIEAARLANEQRRTSLEADANKIRAQNAGLAPLDRESTRFAKPHEKSVADANTQLDKISEARAMINGSAEAQALGIPKVLSSLVGGTGSGLRMTQSELNAIGKARGIVGDAEGFVNSLAGKGKLTDTQKKQLTGLLDDVGARIKQKQAISNDALDRINAAKSRDEIVQADKEARDKLSGLSGGAATSGGIPSIGGTFNGEKVLKVTKLP